MTCMCSLGCTAATQSRLPRGVQPPRLRGLVFPAAHRANQLRLANFGRPRAEKKESTVFGDLIDNSDQQDFPEPGQKDFWEGESWEWLGKLSFVLVPGLVLLAILVGAFAAKTYDSGATSYLAPPSPEDATVKLIPSKPDLPSQ